MKMRSILKYILFFGQVKEYKGLDLLLHALPDTDPSIHLIIAGDFSNLKIYLSI